jgi:hypothetical protein
VEPEAPVDPEALRVLTERYPHLLPMVLEALLRSVDNDVEEAQDWLQRKVRIPRRVVVACRLVLTGSQGWVQKLPGEDEPRQPPQEQHRRRPVLNRLASLKKIFSGDTIRGTLRSRSDAFGSLRTRRESVPAGREPSPRAVRSAYYYYQSPSSSPRLERKSAAKSVAQKISGIMSALQPSHTYRRGRRPAT